MPHLSPQRWLVFALAIAAIVVLVLARQEGRLSRRLIPPGYAGARISVRVDPNDLKRAAALVILGVLGWSIAPVLSPRSMLLLWTAALALVTVPWLDLHGQPLWGAVEWVPFSSGRVRVLDVAANVLIFIPFGALYARMKQNDAVPLHRVVLAALGWAAVFSTLVECSQLFSRGRTPSATDVTTNVAGAVLGAWLLGAWHDRRAQRVAVGRRRT